MRLNFLFETENLEPVKEFYIDTDLPFTKKFLQELVEAVLRVYPPPCPCVSKLIIWSDSWINGAYHYNLETKKLEFKLEFVV